jgi:hypothetical protein
LRGWPNWGRVTFKIYLRQDKRVSIVDIVRMALFFPIFVNEEDNRSLMEEVKEEELKRSFTTSKRIRVMGHGQMVN